MYAFNVYEAGLGSSTYQYSGTCIVLVLVLDEMYLKRLKYIPSTLMHLLNKLYMLQLIE